MKKETEHGTAESLGMTRMTVEFWLDPEQMERVQAIAAEIGGVTVEKAFEFIMLTGSKYIIDKNIAAFARLPRFRAAVERISAQPKREKKTEAGPGQTAHRGSARRHRADDGAGGVRMTWMDDAGREKMTALVERMKKAAVEVRMGVVGPSIAGALTEGAAAIEAIWKEAKRNADV